MAMSPEGLNHLVDDAPALDGMQRSLLESAIMYADNGDSGGAAVYLEAMSTNGLARTLKILMDLTPLARAKLMSK